MKVDLKGTGSLKDELKNLASKDGIKSAIKFHGADLHRKAQRFAPVDTGFLRRSITISIEDSGMKAIIRSNAEYAPYHEYGTRFSRGTPHIGPAFRQVYPDFVSDMKNFGVKRMRSL